MEAGLQVRLDPLGGNQLNIQEALKLCLPPSPPPQHPPQEEARDETNQPSEPEPRRNVADDYDYDDDFIDDGEVIEDEEVAGTPIQSEEDPDFDPDQPVPHSDSDVPKPPEKEPIHHGFATFWVNQGNIPSRKDVAPPVKPPTKLGNVVLERLPIRPNAKSTNNISSTSAAVPISTNHNPSPSNSTPRNCANITSAKTPTAQPLTQPANPIIPKPSNVAAAPVLTSHSEKKSLATTNPPPVKAALPTQPAPKVVRVANRPAPPTAKAKSGLAAVVTEIDKLAHLCQEEFGDKKPKLNDPKVQDQLHVVFKTAIAGGTGRLFSDIGKDKRVVALAEEVWVRLSRFLRTKRANLETLGHALLWSAKEKRAVENVLRLESDLDRRMRERRGDGREVRAVTWNEDVDVAVYEWYQAKSELQNAKNQLGSRVKSVKKCVAQWVAGLKKVAFHGWNVTEGEIIEAFRRVEETRKEAERVRKESDKVEKKRKRDEQMAVSAAKRAAVEKKTPGVGVVAVKGKAKTVAKIKPAQGVHPKAVKNVVAGKATGKVFKMNKLGGKQDEGKSDGKVNGGADRTINNKVDGKGDLKGSGKDMVRKVSGQPLGQSLLSTTWKVAGDGGTEKNMQVQYIITQPATAPVMPKPAVEKMAMGKTAIGKTGKEDNRARNEMEGVESKRFEVIELD